MAKIYMVYWTENKNILGAYYKHENFRKKSNANRYAKKIKSKYPFAKIKIFSFK